MSPSRVPITSVEVIERSISSTKHSSELVEYGHPLQPLAVFGRIEQEVIAPYVVRIVGLESHAAVCAAAEATPLLGLRPVGESGLPPEAVDALRIHGPALALQRSRDEAIAVAGVLGGE